MLLVLATRSPIPSLVGFALVGAGCAAIVPALFRVAAAAPGISSGAGIAAVATAGYTGGVVNGPAIGFLARGIGLTGALGLIAVAGALHSAARPAARTVGSGAWRERSRRSASSASVRWAPGSHSSASRPGIDTVGREVSLEVAEKARDRIAHFLTRKVEKGQLEQDARDAAVGRLSLNDDVADLADCDLVIEAIVESLEPKQELFRELERICRPDTVLATNTSALSVTEIGRRRRRPSVSSACTSSIRHR